MSWRLTASGMAGEQRAHDPLVGAERIARAWFGARVPEAVVTQEDGATIITYRSGGPRGRTVIITARED